jgi:hypothetical protein
VKKNASVREQSVVFGLSDSEGVPCVVLGVSTAAWEYMKGGMCHTFDFTSEGMPLKIIIFRGDSYDAIIDLIKGSMRDKSSPFYDKQDKDFSIK